MEKKRMVELVGALFIAIIFLTSYAAFSSSGTRPSANNTAPAQAQTYYATGRTQANITSYGQVLSVNVSCSNATAVMSSLNRLLTAMEGNGSVSNFYSPMQGRILVQLGNYTAYKVYSLLSAGIGSGAACTSFTSQASVLLPARMSFMIPLAKSSYTVMIPGSQRSVTLPITLSNSTGKAINVSVAALITTNGTIYGSMSVIRV